jgi:hypothetical protein
MVCAYYGYNLHKFKINIRKMKKWNHPLLKKMFHYTFLTGILFVWLSCDKDSKSVLEGCCKTTAIDEDFGNAHLYVSNIFTPNADGINDDLLPLGDSIERIIHFTVYDKDGARVFEVEDVPLFDPSSRWDGAVNGTVKKGLYTITIRVKATDGTITDFEGHVCNYPCGKGEEMISGEGCQFPAQSFDGRYDPTIPSGENVGCFE